MNRIKHVIVLMMENRSFDHMLGFLDHDGNDQMNYPGLSNESNPWPRHGDVMVSRCGPEGLVLGPNHHHVGVMNQIFNKPKRKFPGRFPDASKANNLGFVAEYADYLKHKRKPVNKASDIMRCISPEHIPVLGQLAKQYAVCTNWHCSVPGMTWPNRFFLHAATSHGKADNAYGPFIEKNLIYNRLSDAGADWRIYHDGLSHVFSIVNSQFRRNLKHSLRAVDNLYQDIENNDLAAYSFVECNHFGNDSNSQHPDNNIFDPKKSATYEESIRDFRAGEKLISDIYNALVNKPEVFNGTMFVITYDEHGGLFDRMPPPSCKAPDHDKRKAVRERDKRTQFKFDLLGVRVPAVIISPWVKEKTIDTTLYDHTSVISSVLGRFAPGVSPLTQRDKYANQFWANLNLSVARDNLELTIPYEVPVVDYGNKKIRLGGTKEGMLRASIAMKQMAEDEKAGKSVEEMDFNEERIDAERNEIGDGIDDISSFQKGFVATLHSSKVCKKQK